jgi:propionyl-CoA synthetase
MATIMYEGLPIRPDAGHLVEPGREVQGDLDVQRPHRGARAEEAGSRLPEEVRPVQPARLFLAGEPLDEPTARWISDGLGVPIIDNYWQTESGWPILTIANGVEKKASKFGSPGVPMYGYDVRLVHESTGEELTGPGQKGVVVIKGPTPPGLHADGVEGRRALRQTYWSSIPGQQVYSTFDWGIRDQDGYFYILGRTDDVINVGRPPPRHPRDRGEHLQPPQHRRSGGGGRRPTSSRARSPWPSPWSRTPPGWSTMRRASSSRAR